MAGAGIVLNGVSIQQLKSAFENQPLGSIQLPTTAFSPPPHDSPRS
ncbi:hypothetical protein RESH_00476 [Rhodopirellula europaea SH398]|uniref:Uncharacterized protein n=1 Tax=Rhodopirellula europaea SH398 TaxID=1263868 RepID=M5SBX0_9BACT|nr:hypothetical protein RESH_00476 [Rhodopirellula europaea SH398]